jgi:hypothetical protein
MSDLSLGRLVFSMAADVAQLQRDMASAKNVVTGAVRDIQGALDTVKGALGGLGGALALNEFKNMVDGVYKGAAALREFSVQTGASVEALSGMATVAKATGTSVEEITGAMNKMAKNLAVANEESKGAGQALAALGLNFDTFQRLAPDQKLQAVAQAMAKFEDGSGKSAVAMTLFGKAGAQLLPFLKDLAETGELHAKVTAQQAEQARDFEVALKRVQISGEAWKKELALGMLPALDDTANATLKLVTASGGLRDELRRLSADGTIDEWTRNTVKGLSYFIDAIQVGVRAVMLFGKTIYEQFASVKTLFAGLGQALNAAYNGRFTEAGRILAGTFGEIKDRAGEVKKAFEGIFSDTVGAKMRENIEQQERIRESMRQYGNEAHRGGQETLNFAAGQAKASKDLKDHKDALDAFIESTHKYAAMQAAEAESDAKLTEAQKREVALTLIMEQLKLDETDARVKAARAELEEAAAKEALNAATKEEARFLDEAKKAYSAYLETVAHQIESLDDEIAKEREHVAVLGLTKEQIADLRAAKYDDIAASNDQKASIADLVDVTGQLGDMYRRLAAQYREYAATVRAGAVKQAEVDAANEAAKAWKHAADEINQSLTRAFEDWIMHGKSLAKGLAMAIQQEFASLVLRPIISAVLAPISGLISSGIQSLLGNVLGGAGGAGGSLLSGLFGGGAAASAGSGGFALAGSNAAFNSAVGGGGGAGIGFSSLGTMGIGGLIAAGALLDYTSGRKTGMSPLLSLGLTASLPGFNATTALLQKMGVIQAPGGPKVEGGSGTGGLASFGDTATAQQAATSIADSYKKIAESLGVVNSKIDVGFQFGRDPKGTALTQLNVTGGSYNRAALYGGQYENVGRSDQDYKDAIAKASAQLIIKNLQDQVGGPIGDFLKSIDITSASLDQMQHALDVAQDVGALDKALAGLGEAFASVRNLSVDAQESLINEFAGNDSKERLQSMGVALNAYSQNFLTAAEQHDGAMQELTATLQAAGIQTPATRDAYRALVEAQDLTTDSGRKTYAVLLENAGAFAQLTPAVASATSSVHDALAAWKQAQSELDDALAAWKQAQSELDSAKSALRDYGAALQANVDSIEASINELRGQAMQNARDAFAGVQQANDAAQASLTNAQNALQNALQAVAQQVQAAADRVAAAQAKVKSAQDAITQGYMNAQSQLQQAQQAYDDILAQHAQALRDAGKSIQQALFDINSTSGSAGQRAGVTLSKFYDLAGRAPTDADAASQLAAIAKDAIAAVESSAHSRAEADAQERAIREKLAEVAAAIGAGTDGKTGLDPLVAAQQRIADATAEVAKWSHAIAESGAAMTSSADAARDALNAFEQASEELASAQSSQAALLKAIKDLDLSGVAHSTEVWLSTVDAAEQAQSDLTAAQHTAADAAADLKTALQLAADAGLAWDAVSTDPLDKFRTAIDDFTAVQGNLYDAGDTLVEKYNNQITALGSAEDALNNFNTAVQNIDLADTFDKLKSLLDNYNGASGAADAAYTSLATTQSGAEVVTAYQQLLHRAPEMEGLVYWLDYLAQGHNDADLRAAIMNSPEFQSQATPHATGLWRVPSDGYPAILHRDEAVLTAMQANEWRTSAFAFTGMKAGLIYTQPGGPTGSFGAGGYTGGGFVGGGSSGSGSITTLFTGMTQRMDDQREEMRRIYAEMIYRLQNMDIRQKGWATDGLYVKDAP